MPSKFRPTGPGQRALANTQSPHQRRLKSSTLAQKTPPAEPRHNPRRDCARLAPPGRHQMGHSAVSGACREIYIYIYAPSARLDRPHRAGSRSVRGAPGAGTHADGARVKRRIAASATTVQHQLIIAARRWVPERIKENEGLGNTALALQTPGAGPCRAGRQRPW